MRLSLQMANTPEECSSSKSASEWFSRAVGKPCKLVQQQPGSRSSVNKRQILQPEVQGDRAVQAVRQSIGKTNRPCFCTKNSLHYKMPSCEGAACKAVSLSVEALFAFLGSQ